MGSSGGDRRWLALAALAYLALTALAFRPTPARLAGDIVATAGDPLFNVVVIEWVAASARRGFDGVWSAPWYYPTPWVLALSDAQLGPGTLASLLPASSPRALLVYNALVLLSFPLGATLTALVLRRSGLPPLAAFFGGLAFGFSPYRWSRLSHAQVLLAQWIPVLLWLWDRLLATRRPRTAVAFGVVYALHVTGGTYLAYMAHVPLAVIAAVRLRRHGRDLLRRESLRVLVPTAAACGAMALAVFLPYLLISNRLGLGRSVRETLPWGGTLLSFLTPPANLPYSGPWLAAIHRHENELFAGFLPTALAALGLAVLVARVPAAERKPWQRAVLAVPLAVLALAFVAADLVTLRGTDVVAVFGAELDLHGYKGPGWLALAAVCAWLALRRRWRPTGGTWWQALSTWQRGVLLGALVCALLTMPLAFLPLREVLPGLSGMRVPPRFYPFASFGIAYLAAVGAAAVLAGRGRKARLALAAAMTAVLCWELLPRTPVWWDPMPDRRREVPPTHRWLAENRAEVGAYLELPVRDDSTELRGMYHQSLHHLPMVNGYSGYAPWPALELLRCCAGSAMTRRGVERLQEAGVTHLVISEWKMQREEVGGWRNLRRRLVGGGLAELRLQEGESAVLELLPPEGWRGRRPAAGGSPGRRRPRP